MKAPKPQPSDGRKTFLKKGTCSQTFAYLLNREFDHNQLFPEKATDPLAGGIMKLGHQCGMLWGASLAVGAEAYRRAETLDEAITLAVHATRKIMASFTRRTQTINCQEITGCDWNNRASVAKYMLTGRMFRCFDLAQKWAPEAVRAAQEALGQQGSPAPQAFSCATETIRRLGGSEEEMVMVAGFAGGLGLSGSACGALAAAIWFKTLEALKSGEKQEMYPAAAKKLLTNFLASTKDEVLCEKLTGRGFTNLEEHTAFMEAGGCRAILEVLTESEQVLS